MAKIWTLIKREYLTRVRTKGFLWGTILMPVFIIIMTFMPVLVDKFTTDEAKSIAILDKTGFIAESLQKKLQGENLNAKGTPTYRLFLIDAEASAVEQNITSLEKKVKGKELDAYLIIPADVFDTNQFDFYSNTVSNLGFTRHIENALTDVISRIRLERSGLDAEVVRKYSARINARTFKVGEDGAKEESGFASYAVSYIFVLFLYMALLFYGTFVMRGVTEDKTSRVMEVLLSSASSRQIMAGKIIGIGAVGMTQFLIWVLFAAFSSLYGLTIAQIFDPGISKIAMPSISLWVYVLFLVYFILGFFLYSTLYAAIGSIVNNDGDAQNMQWPVTMFIIFAILFAFPVLQNPSSTFSIILSLFPFFAPILMFLRFTNNVATTVEVLASILLMMLTTWGLIWITARIFRVGILMYGKKPTLKELVKWIKYS